MIDPSRSALGEFLRSRRKKLSWEAVGLPSGRKRRTPDLRREEVAELAGIGVDWYIRLEQGRTVNASLTTVDSLARALRLGQAEHAHLRALAKNTGRPAFAREIVPDTLVQMVKALTQPAHITGLRWDILAWNTAATELFTDFGRQAEQDRNILVYMLTSPDARRLFGTGWTAEARRMVAIFRTTHDLWAHDPAFLELVHRLQQGCPEFAVWWEEHDVRTGVTGQKQFYHLQKGLLRFEYATFQSNDNATLKLAIYTPA